MKNCLTYMSQFVRDGDIRKQTCVKCFAPAYVCYRDCGRFIPDFGKRCSDTCADVPEACSPAEYKGPTAGAATAGIATAAVLGVAWSTLHLVQG